MGIYPTMVIYGFQMKQIIDTTDEWDTKYEMLYERMYETCITKEQILELSQFYDTIPLTSRPNLICNIYTSVMTTYDNPPQEQMMWWKFTLNELEGVISKQRVAS